VSPSASVAPKYALPEIERRWLVDPAALPPLDGLPYRLIEDVYLDGGRLRLRKVSASGLETTFKLGKKYPAPDAQPEPIVNIYLTAAEFAALAALPGRVSRKRRYAVGGGSLDVYEHPSPGLAVFEIEFGNAEAAARYTPPSFAVEEITRNPAHSGYALAGARR